jgi:hypothetical protein
MLLLTSKKETGIDVEVTTEQRRHDLEASSHRRDPVSDPAQPSYCDRIAAIADFDIYKPGLI